MAGNAGQEKVRLYYLGGLGRKAPRPDGKVLPDTVTAAGTRFILPPPGDYLELELRHAKEIEAKHRYAYKGTDGMNYEYSAFTRDKRIADRVKAGETAIQAYQARTVLTVDALSDEALLKELEKRGKLPKVEAQAEEKPEPVKKVAAKPAAKPAKRTPNKNAPKKAVDLVGELTSKASDSDALFEDGIELEK